MQRSVKLLEPQCKCKLVQKECSPSLLIFCNFLDQNMIKYDSFYVRTQLCPSIPKYQKC